MPLGNNGHLDPNRSKLKQALKGQYYHLFELLCSTEAPLYPLSKDVALPVYSLIHYLKLVVTQ
jgi:hypothetical protein